MSAHTEFACPTQGCGHVVCLTQTLEERLRNTHETFYCPAGHRLSFSGLSADEKRIRQLERLVAARDDTIRHFVEVVRGKWAMIAELRQHARVCPLECGYVVRRKWKPESIRRDLADHLVDTHDAAWIDPAEVADAEARA